MRRSTLYHFVIFFFFVHSVISDKSEEWWRDSFIYQVYPRSFKDSDGDGIGDLNGITSKLDHLADIGVSAFWISPIYKSSFVDFGYDIENFTDIDPIFGTLDDFTKLIERAHELNLKVLLDFVPNHTSNKHQWFQNSVKKIEPYRDYYIWKDPKWINGQKHPPNNWLSEFQGSAWTWNNQRKQYYFHQFSSAEPDLNFRNPKVASEILDVLTFWVNRGVDGFRTDANIYLIEDEGFLDEPFIPNTGLPLTDPRTLQHIYTRDQMGNYDLVRDWRNHLNSLGESRKLLITEAYSDFSLIMKYYEYGADIPMNFMFLRDILSKNSTNADFKYKIDEWMNGMPYINSSANWVIDNHDNPRVADRFGKKRADQLIMLAAVLPGVGIVYYGDEIGMENVELTWKETIDTLGCAVGPENYREFSRDPERTPFQWDDTVSAGFSINPKTWLPINPNYKELNLEKQKDDEYSHYWAFKKLTTLKTLDIIKNGSYEVILIGSEALGVIRKLKDFEAIILLINFTENDITVDVSQWIDEEILKIIIPSVSTSLVIGAEVSVKEVKLPTAASVIFSQVHK